MNHTERGALCVGENTNLGQCAAKLVCDRIQKVNRTEKLLQPDNVTCSGN